jgi:hypothetical protein
MVCVREREKPCARNVAVGMYTLGLGENKDSERVWRLVCIRSVWERTRGGWYVYARSGREHVAVGMYTLGLGENKDSEQVRTFR